MNPQLHDEFIVLCALFYSGEISDEEWALLQVHLAYCESCRTTFEQYKLIAKELIPVMAASAAEETSAPIELASSLDASEERLMKNLDVVSSQAKPFVPGSFPRTLLLGGVAACILLLVALAGVHFSRNRVNQASRAIPVLPLVTPTVSPKDTAAEAQRQDQLETAWKEIAALQAKLNAAQVNAVGSEEAIATLRNQIQAEDSKVHELASDREALSSQLVSVQSDLQTENTKLSSALAGAEQQTERVALLETKVQSLSSSLDEAQTSLNDKDRMLALDKDFLSHDRDIRDLIGARNLYIADIFDTTEAGKTAKPFGRIFYTKDSSLVFYGFDLEKQAGVEKAAAFQVWGSGTERSPVSLGLFYQDDSHKRWVLRCNDPKTLAHLNMVFVTVEPPGGSTKPTGKRLLRAYLQIASNHP